MLNRPTFWGHIINSQPLFKVPEIGVEPTRREALAPETSVSTISPLGLAKVGQRYKNLLIYELFFSFISLSHIYIPCPTR